MPQMKDAMGAGTDSNLVVDCFGKHRPGGGGGSYLQNVASRVKISLRLQAVFP